MEEPDCRSSVEISAMASLMSPLLTELSSSKLRVTQQRSAGQKREARKAKSRSDVQKFLAKIDSAKLARIEELSQEAFFVAQNVNPNSCFMVNQNCGYSSSVRFWEITADTDRRIRHPHTGRVSRLKACLSPTTRKRSARCKFIFLMAAYQSVKL